jgi:hypothetical protein
VTLVFFFVFLVVLFSTTKDTMGRNTRVTRMIETILLAKKTVPETRNGNEIILGK